MKRLKAKTRKVYEFIIKFININKSTSSLGIVPIKIEKEMNLLYNRLDYENGAAWYESESGRVFVDRDEYIRIIRDEKLEQLL